MKIRSLSGLELRDREAIEEYIALIRRRFRDRILAVTLIGSKARAEADVESDIDLLVLVDVENDALRDELWRIASDVSLDHSVVLSPRVYGQARWAEIRRIRLPFYRAIEEEGIPLTSQPIPL